MTSRRNDGQVRMSDGVLLQSLSPGICRLRTLKVPMYRTVKRSGTARGVRGRDKEPKEDQDKTARKLSTVKLASLMTRPRALMSGQTFSSYILFSPVPIAPGTVAPPAEGRGP